MQKTKPTYFYLAIACIFAAMLICFILPYISIGVEGSGNITASGYATAFGGKLRGPEGDLGNISVSVETVLLLIFILLTCAGFVISLLFAFGAVKSNKIGFIAFIAFLGACVVFFLFDLISFLIQRDELVAEFTEALGATVSVKTGVGFICLLVLVTAGLIIASAALASAKNDETQTTVSRVVKYY